MEKYGVGFEWHSCRPNTVSLAEVFGGAYGDKDDSGSNGTDYEHLRIVRGDVHGCGHGVSAWRGKGYGWGHFDVRGEWFTIYDRYTVWRGLW